MGGGDKNTRFGVSTTGLRDVARVLLPSVSSCISCQCDLPEDSDVRLGYV